MEKAEFHKSIRFFVEQTPFRPFLVSLTNGDRVTIQDKKYLAYRDGTAGYIDDEKRPWLFDHHEVDAIAVLEG